MNRAARSPISAAVTACLVAASPAAAPAAQTLFWDGGFNNITYAGDGQSEGTTGFWSTSLDNWDQGTGLPHIGWQQGDAAYFGGAAGFALLNSSSISVNLIQVAQVTNGSIYDVDTNNDALTIGSGGIQTGPGSNGLTLSQSPGGSVTLSAAQSWIADPTAPLMVTANVSNGSNLLTTQGPVVISGTLSGTGGLVVAGPGTTTLTGTQTYSGGTAVTGGTLVANGSSGTARVNVYNSGVLAGTGTSSGVYIFGGGTITGGTAAATGAVGTITTGPLEWGKLGVYSVKLASPTSSDRLVMSGLTIDPSAGFMVMPVGTGGTVTLASGSSILIATDSNTSSPSSVNPFQAAIAAGTLVLNASGGSVIPTAGDTLALGYGQDAGGYELYLEDVAAPEPTSLFLAAAAVAPLLGRRRRGVASRARMRAGWSAWCG